LCGLPSNSLQALLERLSRDHNVVLLELPQLLNDGSQEPIGINYRLVDVSNGNERLKNVLKGADSLFFVVPPDCDNKWPDCRALLFSVQQCVRFSTPIAVLVSQSSPVCSASLAIPIKELHLARLADRGVRHLGIYPVCPRSGEGLSNVLEWLSPLFMATLQKEESSSEVLASKWLKNEENESFGLNST
jgi:hypothetical protein